MAETAPELKTQGLSVDEKSELDHYLQIVRILSNSESDTFYGCPLDHISA